MTHPFEQKIQDAIDVHRLVDRIDDRPVICTLSGGADSTALLCAMVRLGYNCVASHCNFHLRGNESMRDHQCAQSVAELLGVQFIAKDMDVGQYRADHSASIEMACRELRYDWFYQLKDSVNAQAIAVAHNLTDNIETMILNMMRGTGIDGLRGMKWRSDKGVVRPMLGIERKDIEQYLSDIGIEFVTDSSNLSDDYMRNKVRHHILPAIARTDQRSLKGVELTISHLSDQSELYHSLIADAMSRCCDADGGINLEQLAAMPQASLMLYEWLKPHGLSMQQAEDAIASRTVSGTRFISAHALFVNDHGMLRYRQPGEQQSDSFPFVISTHPISEFRPSRNPDVAYFDAGILECGQPLSFRYWQHGDTLAPFGMKGTRKLSDIFSDAKLSVVQKQRVPLLMLGSTILWVAGIRASRHYPVSSDSTHFLKVALK